MTSQEKKPFTLKLSAPGKVILFGEYSVVFNKPAVAATLCLRTKLHLEDTETGTVDLDFPALGLYKKFSLKDINEYFKIPSKNSWEEHVQSLTKTFDFLYEKAFATSDLSDAQKFSLITFFHCFGQVFAFSSGFRLKIESELPVGSGVGSSASFSVVLSAAVLLYESYIKTRDEIEDLIERHENGISTVSEKLKAQISEMAFSCEKIFHGSPSGIDHSTILQGSMLEFVRSDKNKISQISSYPIKILLVNTNVPRSTKKLIESMKKLKENHPEVIECVLQAMENVAKSAIADLAGLKENRKDLETHFGSLVSLNHDLLRVLGVSHPTLERMVSVARAHNLDAKLTGAGGGGFGFIYLPSNAQVEVVTAVEEELRLAGLTPYRVTLGGPGLTVEELNYGG